MPELVCKMTYANDEPCDREPEHFVTVSCTNPLCRVNSDPKSEKVALCTPCLQLVMQRGREKCGQCATGMTVTSPPSPIKGFWDPHPLPDTRARS